VQHLIDALKEHYDVSIDLDGINYCGLTFEWHYNKGYIDVSMPNYVEQALDKFHHPKLSRLQNAPHRWTQLAYSKKTQHASEPETKPN